MRYESYDQRLKREKTELSESLEASRKRRESALVGRRVVASCLSREWTLARGVCVGVPTPYRAIVREDNGNLANVPVLGVDAEEDEMAVDKTKVASGAVTSLVGAKTVSTATVYRHGVVTVIELAFSDSTTNYIKVASNGGVEIGGTPEMGSGTKVNFG